MQAASGAHVFDETEVARSCLGANDAGGARGCAAADFATLHMCDDFDSVDEFTPILVNQGSRALVSSPISPPSAFAFTVPMSNGVATAAGQRYTLGTPNYSSTQALRIKLRMKLDASCANVPNDSEATIIEFVMLGASYRYVYAVRLAGLTPFVEIRHEPQVGSPLIARGQRALPTDTWFTISEELTDTTAAVAVDCVTEASGSRGGLPPTPLQGGEIYMGLDAPMGWSNCTITFDDLMINDL